MAEREAGPEPKERQLKWKQLEAKIGLGTHECPPGGRVGEKQSRFGRREGEYSQCKGSVCCESCTSGTEGCTAS